MKNLYYYSIVFVILTISNGKWWKKTDNNNILSISIGSMSAFCHKYRHHSISIASIPSQIIVSKESCYKQSGYPTLRRFFPFSSNEWEKLVNLVDLEKFKSLNDHIECGPRCVTDWSQWIQINWINRSKLVSLSLTTLSGFEFLVNKFHEIMKQYAYPLELEILVTIDLFFSCKATIFHFMLLFVIVFICIHRFSIFQSNDKLQISSVSTCSI
jgi:hypothetical protein